MFFFNKLIFFLITFLFINFASNAESNTAFIDLNKILNDSNSGKKVLATLDKLNKKNSKLLEIEQKKIKKLETEINDKKNVISKEDLKKKLSNLNTEIQKFKSYNIKLNNDFSKIRSKEIKNFFEKVNPTIQSYMVENKIKIILEKKNIYIASQEKDITDIILKLID